MKIECRRCDDWRRMGLSDWCPLHSPSVYKGYYQREYEAWMSFLGEESQDAGQANLKRGDSDSERERNKEREQS